MRDDHASQPRGIVTPEPWYDHCGLGSRSTLPACATCAPHGRLHADRDRALPTALRPAVYILHAGWRGLLAGIVGPASRARARHPRRRDRAGIGPCCFEVGEEVAMPFRAAFGDDVVRTVKPRPVDGGGTRSTRGGRGEDREDRPLHRLRRSGSSRTGATTAAQAGRESLPSSSDELRERYAQIREEVGSGVTVVVATKYVPIDELAALPGRRYRGRRREPGAGSRGEACALRRPQRSAGTSSASCRAGKAKTCERGSASCATRSTSESAAERLKIPALVEVNLSGEPTKSGIEPEQLSGSSSSATTTCGD